MDWEQIVAELAEKIDRRFYGKYRGFVVDNADPQHLGRLKVRVPSLLGPEVVTGWALPCVPYGGMDNQGFLFIPEKDAGVWVEFEEGDLEFPIWTGTFWSKPGGVSELPRPNNQDGTQVDSEQDPPTRKIIKTKKGHTIQFEDGDAEERIIIADGSGGNLIVFSEKGITIQDANKNTIIMDNTSGGLPGTPGIKINGEKMVCLDGLITWLLKHTHMGNLGAPCPLNPADSIELNLKKANPDGDTLSKGVRMG